MNKNRSLPEGGAGFLLFCVCWIRISGIFACCTVLTSDKLTGPCTAVREHCRPLGCKVGDFDLAEDPESGRVFLFEAAVHAGVAVMRLTPGCTEAEEIVSRQYEG